MSTTSKKPATHRFRTRRQATHLSLGSMLLRDRIAESGSSNKEIGDAVGISASTVSSLALGVAPCRSSLRFAFHTVFSIPTTAWDVAVALPPEPEPIVIDQVVPVVEEPKAMYVSPHVFTALEALAFELGYTLSVRKPNDVL